TCRFEPCDAGNPSTQKVIIKGLSTFHPRYDLRLRGICHRVCWILGFYSKKGIALPPATPHLGSPLASRHIPRWCLLVRHSRTRLGLPGSCAAVAIPGL